MRLLAIDSSGLVASAAILEEETLIAEYTMNYKKTHSETLLPMIDEIVRATETALSELDAIAVAAGPGSFTGLRIGSATAKGLALALDKPIVPVPTLEGLAWNLWGSDALLCPMMDARRSQVYTGLYRFAQGKFLRVMPQTACPVEEILDRCREEGGKIVFLGDGVPVYRETIAARMQGSTYAFAPAHLNRQRAAAVGALAVEYYREGKFESADDHAPVYLRKSQAERELLKKKAQG